MDLLLKENAQLLLHIEKQMNKVYNENNKLQKQSNILTNHTPVYINHCIIKKQFVVTYVRSYEGPGNELHIKQFGNVISPDVYDKGLFIISRCKNDQMFDEDLSMNGFTPMNSTLNENSNEHNNSLVQFTSSIDVPIEKTEYVNCGTVFSATDILAGGKKEYHGSLGLIKKVVISIEALQGFSVVDARQLCSTFVQCIKLSSNVDRLPPLLLPCKAEKPLNLSAMICYPNSNNSTGTVHFHEIEVRNDISVIKDISKNSEEIAYTSTYDILGEFKVEKSESEIDETSLNIEFYWSDGDYKVMQHPPHSAKTILKLQVTGGEARSAVHGIFLELTALDAIVNSTHSNSSSRLSNSSSSDNLYEQLVAFKETASDFSFYGNHEKAKQSTSEKTDDLETPMSQLIQQSFQRNDHDFTDKLWIFLQQVESIDDLRSYLDDILSDIVHGALQPAISPTNETKLAKYIRRMYLADNEEGKLHMKEKILEFLSNEQAVQGLVSEIGFEKIRKDYFNFFTSKELATSENLQKLFKPNMPADISVLWKLYYCLEIVITPAIYLNLAQDCQAILLKDAINYYCSHSVGASSPVFCLSLLPFHDSSSFIHQACEARQPVLWKQGVIRTNKAGLKETDILRVLSKDMIGDEDNSDFIGTKHDVIHFHEGVITLPFCISVKT